MRVHSTPQAIAREVERFAKVPHVLGSNVVAVFGYLMQELVCRGTMTPEENGDIRLQPEAMLPVRHFRGAGGAAANFAFWLGRLGIPVRFVGQAGAAANDLDPTSPLVRQLTAVGVEVVLHRVGRTAQIVSVVPAKTARHTGLVDEANCMDLPPEIVADHLGRLLDDAHIGYLSGWPQAFPDTPAARTNGLLASQMQHLDGGMVVDAANVAAMPALMDVLGTTRVRLLALGQQEAAAGNIVVGDSRTYPTIAETVVVHQGPAEAWLWTGPNARPKSFAARPVSVTGSDLGAGDAFLAGYVAALAKGYSNEEAMPVAHLLGSHSLAFATSRPVLSRPLARAGSVSALTGLA